WSVCTIVWFFSGRTIVLYVLSGCCCSLRYLSRFVVLPAYVCVWLVRCSPYFARVIATKSILSRSSSVAPLCRIGAKFAGSVSLLLPPLPDPPHTSSWHDGKNTCSNSKPLALNTVMSCTASSFWLYG